jgi:nicotinate-nucleotide--dimethylbenzimidazole phosphoribosyltransferase
MVQETLLKKEGNNSAESLITLEETISKIKPVNEEIKQKTREKVDGLLKPVGSLGLFENMVVQLGGIMETTSPNVDKKAIVVCAADHGIVEEGITAAPKFVTELMTYQIPKYVTGVGVIAKQTNAEIVLVDVGVDADIEYSDNLVNRKIRKGTANMRTEQAMTREEAIQSIEVGIEIATNLINNGVTLLGTGEMGIGNTTPSSAIMAVLSGEDPEKVTGAGANLPDDKVLVKIEVIKDAISLHKPDKDDAIDVLSKVGGLEIGAMAGVMLAGAANKVPVVIDGFISTAAAAIAITLNPLVKDYLICSHMSHEKAAAFSLDFLGFKPYLDLGFRLGEGSGAAVAFSLIDGAVRMNNEMSTYAEQNLGVV